jgi:hypothetical protein
MWARVASVLLGLWLMAAPAVLGYGRLAADNDHVIGPLVVAFATVAMSAVLRSLRWVSVALGGWLLLGPWLLGHPPLALVNDLVVGLLLIALAFVRGSVGDQLGGGWAALFARESCERPGGAAGAGERNA